MLQIVESIISVLTPLLGVMLPLFWNKLKAYHTQIIAIIVMLIGVYQIITQKLLPAMCETLGLWCDVEASPAYGVTTLIAGFFMYMRRLLDSLPPGDLKDLPQKMMAKKKA